MEKHYDYDKERSWISTLFEMQIEQNKSMMMRIKRLEDIADNLNSMVYGDDLDTPTGLGLDTSGKSRFKI